MHKQVVSARGSEVGSHRRGDGGNIDSKLSPWFSFEITHEEWPWVFAKSHKASLIISTPEALAVLVAAQTAIR